MHIDTSHDLSSFSEDGDELNDADREAVNCLLRDHRRHEFSQFAEESLERLEEGPSCRMAESGKCDVVWKGSVKTRGGSSYQSPFIDI